jgi:ubiquinone/menaquinone biosynthesis C-methylase UbiE
MVAALKTDAPTFKEQELAGWEAKANAYGAYAGRITAQIIPSLLDALRLEPGAKLLDIACGPGYVAGAAAERGAQSVGLDFAPAMVLEAKRNFPRADFQQGDAEALPFAPQSFDAASCAFGLGHLAEPDKAIAQAFRVLRPGGRFAFTWWCSPEKHEFFALFFAAVKAHGNPDVALPPAPPVFRFSDAAECKRALSKAGFVDPEVREHWLVHEVRSPQEVIDLINKSSVRTAMVLELQSKEALERIHEALLSGMSAFKRDDGYRIGWPAIIAAARKP